jgi:hypothetical protein
MVKEAVNLISLELFVHLVLHEGTLKHLLKNVVLSFIGECLLLLLFSEAVHGHARVRLD